MKKIIMIILMCMLTAGMCAGCASDTAQGNNGGKPRIITTVFPEYDWVREIMGENADRADVRLLLDKGVDMHSYQPTADDIMAISGCDMIIYVGGESDGWVEDALEEAVNKDMVVINLLEVLGDKAKTEETVEGMEDHDHDEDHDDEHDHDGDNDHAGDHDDGHDHDGDNDHAGDHEDEHDHDHDDDHDHEEEYDEHVWLSLNNAQILCEAIADGLAGLDPENGDTYKANCKAYKEKLHALDKEYRNMVDNAPLKTLLFGDRFPFRYLTDDYGLGYFAAFAGCSAETEASFKTIVFLAGKTDELKLPAILTIDGSDGKIASTIRDNTAGKDQKILTLNSMQSVTLKDAEGGVSYISIMKENLAVLKEALGNQ